MAEFDPDAFLAEKEDEFDPDAFLAGDKKTKTSVLQPEIDPASALVLKGSQGILQGGLDELSGGFEALGSLFNLRGVGGPTGDITWGDDRTMAQAYEEGSKRKQQMLAQAQVQRPVLSTLSELGGGIASGVAIPGTAATTLGKMGIGAGLSGISGSLYSEGDLGDRLAAGAKAAPIGAIIPGAAAGVSKLASSDTAKKIAREGIKKFGRAATTMPEELIERYLDRGRLMNKDDSLVQVAEDIPKALNNLRDQARAQSYESRKILEAEGVKVPRFEIMRRLKDLIGSADPYNESVSPVLAKLKQRLGALTERPGTIEDIKLSGAAQATVPTSTRTVVGGAPTPTAQRSIYGIPKDEARGAQKTLQGIDEVNISGNQQVIQPTQSRGVVTTPGYRPPDQMSGGQVKDIVQDIGELIDNLGGTQPGFKASSGANLARQAYGSIQEPIKQASPAYTAKMKEINDLMEVLDTSRERFGDAEQTFNKLRLIGGNQDRGHWARKDLEQLEGVVGGDFTNRVKDAITLDAFTKPGVQGSRSVNIGRAAGGTAGPVGETIGGFVGGAVDYYGRSLLKKGIDLQQRIQFMPPQYKQVFDRALQKGGNAAAVAHHTLFTKDPEYRKLMQEMDEQAEQ